MTSLAFVTHIGIFDYRNWLIREMDQDFGYHGELTNASRVVSGGKAAYLYWDNHDAKGNQAEDGIYVWKIHIVLASNKVVDLTQKTGLLGPACTAAP